MRTKQSDIVGNVRRVKMLAIYKAIKKKIMNSQGVTLVEVIVALIISAVLMTSVAAILPPVLRIYAHANTVAERNTLLNNIANHLTAGMQEASEEILFTSGATVGEEGFATLVDHMAIASGKGLRHYYINDGFLYSRYDGYKAGTSDSLEEGNLVLPKGFYNHYRVSFTVVAATSVTEPGVVAYELIVNLRNAEEEVSRSYIVAPMVLNSYGESLF